MLDAAKAAKERLMKRSQTAGGAIGAPPRTPVCSEDAAAHASLMQGQGGGYMQSQNPMHCGQPPSPQQQFQGYGYGVYGGAAAQYQQTVNASAFGGYAPPPRQASFGGFRPPASMMMPTMPAGYGSYGVQGYAGYPGGRSTPADSQAIEDEDEGEEDDGPRVAPLVTARLTLCYILLFGAGLWVGMVANELHWASLKNIHPALEDLEAWLHEPHDDPLHVRVASRRTSAALRPVLPCTTCMPSPFGPPTPLACWCVRVHRAVPIARLV